MLGYNYRLMRLIRCLAYIYGIDDKSTCQTIRNTRKLNRNLLEKIAYQYHMSNNSLYLVEHGDFAPMGKVLWAYSQCVSSPYTLLRYLHANRLASNTSIPAMLRQTQLSYKQLQSLNNPNSKLSIQDINQLAKNLHIPPISLIRTAQRAHVSVYNVTDKVPVLVRKYTPRTALKNYLKCLCLVHGMTAKGLAIRLGTSYSSLVRNIKQMPKDQLIKKLHPLAKIFYEARNDSVGKILRGDYEPRNKFISSSVRHVHDRKHLGLFVHAYGLMNGISATKLSRALGKSPSGLGNSICEMSFNKLKLLMIKIAHALQMPEKLAMKAVNQRGVKPLQFTWPKHLYFVTHYVAQPYQYHGDMMLSDKRQAKINSLKYALKQAVTSHKSPSMLWQYLTQIIQNWSQEFGFDAHKFIIDNFPLLKNHNQPVRLHQGTVQYPINTLGNWKQTLDGIYTQLSVIDLCHNKNEVMELPSSKYLYIFGKKITADTRKSNLAEKLCDHHKHVFTCQFDHTGVRTIKSTDKLHKEFYRPIIVLKNIHYDGKQVLTHTTMNYTKLFVNLGRLQHDDTINVLAVLAKKHHDYVLNRANQANITKKAHERDDSPVPHDIHALTGFAIEDDKSGNYDFTTWGHNYGYVRYCLNEYKKWQKKQNNHQKGLTENAL